MTDARAEFLAGERHEDVVLYLADRVLDDPEPLLEYGERVEGGILESEASQGSEDERSESSGVLLVMDGETGRSVFQSATEMDAMAFAGKAMRTDGEIDRDLTGGSCPKAGAEDEASDAAAEATDGDAPDAADDGSDEASPDADHETRFVFAFSEAENPDVGGRYGEGDVIHAYAHCACGAAYSENWTVGE